MDERAGRPANLIERVWGGRVAERVPKQIVRAWETAAAKLRSMRPLPLTAFLLLLGFALLLPSFLLSTFLLARFVGFERAQFEQRLQQSAVALADVVDRELENSKTTLRVLANSETLNRGDFAEFHREALKGLGSSGVAILVLDRNLQQLANTNVPFGTPLPKTADPVTASKVLATKEPQVSDLFLGRVTGRLVLDVLAPVMQGREVRYILLMSFAPDRILRIIEGQNLPRGWVAGVSDSKGTVIARSQLHEQYVNTRLPPDLIAKRHERGVFNAQRVDGVPALRAVVQLQHADWVAAVTVPLTLAEAASRRSIATAATIALALIALSLLFGFVGGHTLLKAVTGLTEAGRALGRGDPVVPVVSPIQEVNQVSEALSQASAERKQAEEVLETLNSVSKVISSDLDLKHIVQTVTDVATELSGARFGAFFYNVIDADGERYMLYALSGAPREAFDRFGVPRNTALFERTFRGLGVVRSDDIRSDPRYGRSAPHFGMPKGHLPVVSYLAVPVVSRSGEVHGGLFFGHDRRGMFTDETERVVSGIAAHASIAIDNTRLLEKAQAETESKELLLNEIKHRVKNTLATVQAIASQTLSGASAEERDAFVARLHAMAKAHDLLTQEGWRRAPLREVVRRALEPFQQERFHLQGPSIDLNANRSLLLTMVLHELATNAVKYGALSNDSGQVEIAWNVTEGARLKFAWRESGGPPVAPPTSRGFGSIMIEQTLTGAHIEFAPSGVTCTFEMTL